MPLIESQRESIIKDIAPSKAGLERRVVFTDLTYSEINKFLSISFRCEYGKYTDLPYSEEELLEAEQNNQELLPRRVWELFDNKDVGIQSFPQTFRADNSTLVTTSGDIIKLPTKDPFVDLSDPNLYYMGQFDFFLEMARTTQILIGDLIMEFVIQANETNNWNDL